MKIGIVTPTLNAERFLGACLRSVWAHVPSGVKLDHVVVDGGSSDATQAIVRESPARLIVAHDRGMYEAVNRGFREVDGDVVAYVNADDELVPETIARVALEFCRPGSREWLYGDIELIDRNGETIVPLRMVNISKRSLAGIGWSPIHSMTVWCKRTFLDAVGHYDIAFKNAADYDWYLRALDAASPTVVHQPLARFRLHDDNLSLNPRIAVESRIIQERHGGTRMLERVAGYGLRVRLNAKNLKWYSAKQRGLLGLARGM